MFLSFDARSVCGYFHRLIRYWWPAVSVQARMALQPSRCVTSTRDRRVIPATAATWRGNLGAVPQPAQHFGNFRARGFVAPGSRPVTCNLPPLSHSRVLLSPSKAGLQRSGNELAYRFISFISHSMNWLLVDVRGKYPVYSAASDEPGWFLRHA
ncbi:hypothetical protein V2G26_008731 [Clonostachys chloroleuca]